MGGAFRWHGLFEREARLWTRSLHDAFGLARSAIDLRQMVVVVGRRSDRRTDGSTAIAPLIISPMSVTATGAAHLCDSYLCHVFVTPLTKRSRFDFHTSDVNKLLTLPPRPSPIELH